MSPVSILVALKRNQWVIEHFGFLPTRAGRWFGRDGLWTKHAQPFLDDPAFQQSYARAVKAAGWDYGIPWRLHTLLWAATICQSLQGAFVECGTGRGFMASGICEYLKWTDRPFYLYDTFLPYSPDERGDQQGVAHPVYTTSPRAVEKNFSEWSGVQCVVGRVPETFRDPIVERVSFLHVDMNHPDPEEAAVRHFWPRLVSGAIMVYDDYGFPQFDTSQRPEPTRWRLISVSKSSHCRRAREW